MLAAPPPTSRSRRRSSTRCAPSGRSARTSTSSRFATPAHARHGDRRRRGRRRRQGRSSGRASTPTTSTSAETLVTDLNVFESFEPKLSQASRTPTSCSWPTSSPTCSFHVREQGTKARFVAMDSMNLWIDIANASLKKVIGNRRLPDPQRRGARAADRGSRRCSRPRTRSCRGARRPSFAKLGKYGAALFTPTTSSRCPPTRWPRSSTRPARATRSPAASSATSRRIPTRRSTTRSSRARWPTAPRWRPTNVEEFGTERVERLTRRTRVQQRVADLQRMTGVHRRPGRAQGLSAAITSAAGRAWASACASPAQRLIRSRPRSRGRGRAAGPGAGRPRDRRSARPPCARAGGG